MLRLLLVLLRGLRSALRSHADLALENLALLQQLAAFAHSGRRPRIRAADRLFWVALYRLWSRWLEVLVFVKPETVIRWHRAGFRRYWTWRYMPRRPPRPDAVQRWLVFLHNHRDVIAAMDFFTVPTVTFRILYNLKAAVIRAAFGVGGQTALNRSYRELARHYGFKVDPTPPRSPKKKRKVSSRTQPQRNSSCPIENPHGLRSVIALLTSGAEPARTWSNVCVTELRRRCQTL
jgi:hypothetical protein